jgi:hypothetical protein
LNLQLTELVKNNKDINWKWNLINENQYFIFCENIIIWNYQVHR